MKRVSKSVRSVREMRITYCYKECTHGNYCINEKGHEDKHTYHNAMMGLQYSYCNCKGTDVDRVVGRVEKKYKDGTVLVRIVDSKIENDVNKYQRKIVKVGKSIRRKK